MAVSDDFRLWERELRETTAAPQVPEQEQEQQESGPRGMLVVVALVACGCTAMIAIGQAALGAAGLVLSALILVLWRAGM